MDTVYSQGGHAGIHLPVDLCVESDWRDFVAAIGASASDFFLKGSADGSAAAISGLLKFATSTKFKKTPGYLAWNLTVTSLAWSIEQISDLDQTRKKELAKLFRTVLESSRILVDDGIFVPAALLDRPTSLPLYRKMADDFIEVSEGYYNVPATTLRYKIDSAFNRAITEVFLAKPELYQPLMDSLDLPTGVAASLEASWQLYRTKLVYDFEVKPLFGQEQEKVSLSELYVPLRGTWTPEDTPHDGSEHVYADNLSIVRIDQDLDDWIEEESTADWLRLIGGGPGSGKSTTLKALACRMAKQPTCRPLFIPLQNVDLESDLREGINKYFTESTDSAFVQPPLSRASAEDGAPLLLIFDGLDELVAPGEAAKDVVGTFANRLNSLVTSLSGNNNRKIRVIVSGRMPAFQAANRYLSPPRHGALETLGFLPREHVDEDDLWQEDQRIQWWSQYASLKGEPLDAPEAFTNPRLEGLTNEPLLCYLLVLAGFATQDWELAADNRNRIYSSLIESIYERGWGDGAVKRLGPGKTLSKSDFVKLMETIALAAWLGGDARVATEDNFESAIVIMDALTAWEAFTADNGQDVANLAMNFYLKSSQKYQRGFEFTHKSFGEYLSARALLCIADDVAAQAQRKPDFAMQDWYRATRTGKPSSELLTFLRDELRLRLQTVPERSGLDAIRLLKKSFENLISRASQDGFPILPGTTTWREREQEQGSAECALWLVVNSCAVALSYSDEPSQLVQIQWIDDGELSRIIQRLLRLPGCSVILACMSFLDARHQSLSGFRADGLDFEGAYLAEVTFVALSLERAVFRGAFMNDCRFYMCNIHNVDFTGASMRNVLVHVSQIRGANFGELVDGAISISPLTFVTAQGLKSINLGSGLSLMLSRGESIERIKTFIEERTAELNDEAVEVNTRFVGDIWIDGSDTIVLDDDEDVD